MALFEYEQLGSAGGTLVIEAPDRQEALRALRQRGVTPRRLEELDERRSRGRAPEAAAQGAAPVAPTRPREAAKAGASSGHPRVSRADMAGIVRDLAISLGAGLTLVQAMRVIQRQSRSPGIRAMLAHVSDQVEQGRSFADAAASWGRPFDEMLVGLLRAGEQSGRLVEVLRQAATLLERDQKMRRSLAMGMVYPAVLAVLIAGAVTVVVTFVVPRLLKPLAGRMSVADLPWPTRVVLFTTDFFAANWFYILLALGAAVVIGRQALAQPDTRLSIDRFLLRVPAIGRLSKDVAVARFARTMCTLVGAGLPVLTAIRGARGVVGNRAVQHALDDVAEAVQAGKTIAEPMERAENGAIFPPLLTQIVGVGERTGRLPEMLERAADLYEDRTETSIKIVTTLVPPVLVILAAIVVGFVMAGVLLAALEVQNAIG
ncbi:MAG TPA: type II secretion system F family protein [Phycisphaerales bacterium]|nr:type II secretion system F family protein [Phycisphaerales bacterium]